MINLLYNQTVASPTIPYAKFSYRFIMLVKLAVMSVAIFSKDNFAQNNVFNI